MVMREDQPPLSEEDRQGFHDFWDAIVCPGGVWDLEQVTRELIDYEHLLGEVPKVYGEITGGLMSKPHYYADDVIKGPR